MTAALNDNLLAALEAISASYGADPELFATELAQSLRNEVIRSFNAEDAYVGLDLDTGDLEIEAYLHDGSARAVSLSDLGRRGAAMVKEAFDRAVVAARADRVAALVADRAGTLVTGRVSQLSPDAAIVDLGDGVEAELRRSRAGAVTLRRNMTISSLLTGAVDSTGGTPRAVLTRLGTDFIKALLADTVPSVADGSIEVTRIAREPGVRTKICVSGSAELGDPVAIIIGSGGSTIRRVTDHLGPERVDVIAETDDVAELVEAALVPGKVRSVEVGPDGSVTVDVYADQRPAIFGRGGTNVRLASELVGADIRVISSDSPAA